jgi:hypothetical protein
MRYTEKNFKQIQLCLLFVGFALSFFYAQHQILTGDQTQMLYKGYMGVYHDSWSSFGNAASVVGNVPGSMISFAVGVPIMLYDSPWSPMVVLIFLHLFSYLLLDSVLKDIFKSDLRLVFLVMYWLNPWFLFENILYNPSYLFFFSALHLWTAYQQREKSSFFYSALHVVSIGFALQFHYSWLILAILSLYLVFRKTVKINWYGVFFGATLVLVSLIPYAIEFMNNEAIRHNQDAKAGERYIGWGGTHVYPVLKSFIYWLRYGSFFFPNKLIASAHFEWLGASHIVQIIFIYLYKAIVFSVGAVTIYISYKANRFFYERVKSKVFARNQAVSSKEEWLLLYVFGALFGVFIGSILSPIIFSYWHLIIVFPFAILPFLVYFQSYSEKYLKKFLFFTISYFLLINIMGAVDSRKYSIDKDYAQDVKEFVVKTIKNPE